MFVVVSWVATRFNLPPFLSLAPLNHIIISFSISLAVLVKKVFFNTASVTCSLKYNAITIYQMKHVTVKIS